MLTIQSAMLIALGVFLSGLVVFLVAPFYRKRAARLATDALRRSMPLSEAEIRADKDRLRAEHAIAIHKLEMKLSEVTLSSAKKLIEINRRDAAISALEGEIASIKTGIEEHENARRVLEQTITDRLPRVEQRLGEAKKLLFQRDREIAELTAATAKQAQALEEAAQINAQQRDENHRLNAVLATRAARNREVMVADARFDEEVALRSELEALRAKARDQAAMIRRLQDVHMRPAAAIDAAGLVAATGGQSGANVSAIVLAGEPARLRNDLAEAEIALKAVRGAAEAGHAGNTALEGEIRQLKSRVQDQTTEIAKLKAALKAYEAEDADVAAVKDSKIAMKARLGALEAQSEQQQATIHSLRAEVVATNERLARQASQYVEELRRLGSGTVVTGPGRRASYDAGHKRSLSDRITAPRTQTPSPANGNAASAHAKSATPASPKPPQDEARVTGFLRALDGAAGASAAKPSSSGDSEASGAAAANSNNAPAADGADEAAAKPGRRPGLLARITGIDKPAASGG